MFHSVYYFCYFLIPKFVTMLKTQYVLKTVYWIRFYIELGHHPIVTTTTHRHKKTFTKSNQYTITLNEKLQIRKNFRAVRDLRTLCPLYHSANANTEIHWGEMIGLGDIHHLFEITHDMIPWIVVKWLFNVIIIHQGKNPFWPKTDLDCPWCVSAREKAAMKRNGNCICLETIMAQVAHQVC